MTGFQKVGVVLLAVVVAAVAWAAIQAGVAAGARSEAVMADRSQPPMLSTTGSAVVRAAPDTATATVSVGVQKWRAREAEAGLRRAVKAIVAAMEAAGLPERNITTARYTLGPHYETINGRSVFKRYYASTALALKIQPPEQAGKMLDAAMGAGASSVGDVQFVVDDIKALRRQARELAGKNARDRAQQTAKALGVRLGPARMADEQSGYWSGYYWEGSSRSREGLGAYQETLTMPAAESGPPEEQATGTIGIAPGMVSVTASVGVQFSLRS